MKKLLVVLLFITSLFSQTWNIYNAENSGLNYNTVRAVERVNDDLWIGTSIGLCKFNINNNYWTVYNSDSVNIIDNSFWVYSISYHDNGILWVCTDGNGLLKYKTDWKNYTINNSDLPHNTIHDIINFKDTLWIGTYGGIVKAYGQNWNIYDINSSNLLSNLIETFVYHNDTLWVGTWGGGLVKIYNNNMLIYNVDNSDISSNYIQKLFLHDDVLWIGTWEGGLTKKHNNIWTKYTTENSDLPDNYINAICYYKNKLAIGTFNSGLTFLNLNDNTFFTYNITNSELPDNQIHALSSDSNNLWIGTNKGIVQYTEKINNIITCNNYELITAYPNPFNSHIKINININNYNNLKICIFTLNGNLIKEFYDNDITWNANSYSSGIYIVNVIINNDIIFNKKIIYIK